MNRDGTHRDDSEDGVDDAGSDGGVDGLLHTSCAKDPCGVVEHLRDAEREEKKETRCFTGRSVGAVSYTGFYIVVSNTSDPAFTVIQLIS